MRLPLELDSWLRAKGKGNHGEITRIIVLALREMRDGMDAKKTQRLRARVRDTGGLIPRPDGLTPSSATNLTKRTKGGKACSR